MFLRTRTGRMIGKPIFAFVAPEDRSALRSALNSCTLRGELVRHTATVLPRGADVATVEVTLASAPGQPRAVSWILLTPGAAEAHPSLGALPETLTQLSTLSATAVDPRAAAEASAELVAAALGPGVHVSVATGSPLEPTTLGSSSDLAQQLDGAQVQAGEGPSVMAFDTAALVEAEELVADERWPRLAERVPAGTGALALPLSYGGRSAGVLSVYCQPGARAAGLAEPCGLFAATVAAVIYELEVKAELSSVAEGLERAMASRAVIEQAKGVVMAAKHCDAEEAFEYLVELSSVHHLKLREVARRIIEDASAP
jgi:hypothetical protein